MKEKNIGNHRVLSTAITTVIFLALIFTATYAIVGATIVYDDSNVTTDLASRPIFTSTPSGPISLEMPLLGTTPTEAYVLDTASASLSVALSTGYSTSTTCTYDLIWKWNEASDANGQYFITTGATKEYTVSGTMDASNSFEETQLGNYSTSVNTLLYSGSITATSSSMVTQTWNFTANFYKTTQIQTGHIGGSYAGQIIVENVICSNS